MQTTYNAFSGPAPASNDNAFQSAIDYLIANRQKPVFNNGGLFAQGSQANTPTSNLSSVISDLFGDEYIKKNKGGGGSNVGVDPVTGQPLAGNPYSGRGLFGTPSFNDVAAGLARQGSLERGRDTLSQAGGFLGGLAGFALPGAFLAKHVVPWVNNEINDWQYDRALSDYDAQAANVAAAQGVAGIGTYSNADGRLGTYSSPASIAAADAAMFGDSGGGSSYDSLSSAAVSQSLADAGYSDTGGYGEGAGGFDARSSGGGIGVDGW